MAVSETGQQLRNLAARYDLPPETLGKAFEVPATLDQFGAAPGGPPLDAAVLLQAVGQELQQTLGPNVFEAWNARGESAEIRHTAVARNSFIDTIQTAFLNWHVCITRNGFSCDRRTAPHVFLNTKLQADTNMRLRPQRQFCHLRLRVGKYAEGSSGSEVQVEPL